MGELIRNVVEMTVLVKKKRCKATLRWPDNVSEEMKRRLLEPDIVETLGKIPLSYT